MIFNLLLAATWGPGMLYNLDVFDVTMEMQKDAPIYRIKRRIGTTSASTCEQDGLSAVNDKPSSVTIWKREQLDDVLCMYGDIEEYLHINVAI